MQITEKEPKIVYLVEAEHNWSGKSFYVALAAFTKKEDAENYIKENPMESWESERAVSAIVVDGFCKDSKPNRIEIFEQKIIQDFWLQATNFKESFHNGITLQWKNLFTSSDEANFSYILPIPFDRSYFSPDEIELVKRIEARLDATAAAFGFTKLPFTKSSNDMTLLNYFYRVD